MCMHVGRSTEVAVAVSVPVVLLFTGVVGVVIVLGVLLLVYKLRLKSMTSASNAEDSVAFKEMIYSQEDDSLSAVSLEKQELSSASLEKQESC